MHRIEGANATSGGLFTEGPPATTVTEEWLNAVQEEIAYVIEQTGFSLLNAVNDTRIQLYTAIRSIVDYGMDTTELTTDSTLTINKRHIVNAPSGDRLTLTLPALSPVGSKIVIMDKGGRGFKVAQNTPHNVLWMNQSTIPGSTGYIETKTGYSSMTLECITANSTWQVTELRDNVQMKGYLIGGYDGVNKSLVESIDFNTEVGKVIDDTIGTAKFGGAGVSSHLKGYMMGGQSGTSQIYSLVFSDESVNLLGETLDTGKYDAAGISSNSKGYALGGFIAAASAIIDELVYSDESSQTIAATLDTAKSDGAGISSNLKGYMLGGDTGAGAPTNVIEDFIFSDETSQALVATLDTAKFGGEGIFYNLKGFIVGGDTGATTNVIEDFIFSDETSQAISATLSAAKKHCEGVSSSLKGYVSGGYTGAAYLDVVEGFSFLNESIETLTYTLSDTRSGITGVQGYL